MKALFKYTVIFLICFAAAGTASYYAVKIFTQSAEEVILPDLKGKNILYVLETLTRMGLNAKLYGTQYHETLPTYAVITQDPAPGNTIKKGRDVILYISKGKKENIVPDLRYLPLSQALIAIEKNEFKKGCMVYTWSDKAQKDTVMAQYPLPFQSAQKEKAFDLLISKGPRPMALMMPDWTGQTLANATLGLEQLDLKVKKIQSGFKPDQPMGVVLSQSPAPGSYVEPNDGIELFVNKSRQQLSLSPDIVGKLHYLHFRLAPGFRKHRVRIETDLFGSFLNLYDAFYAPGQELSVLVPVEKKMIFNIYIDEYLENTIILDPWDTRNKTGDTKWELLPPQFYPQTSPNWEMN